MAAVSTTDNLYDVLLDRGLVAQATDEKLRDRLASAVTAYIGFDPTADSLHVGSLVPIMALAWLQRCGHKPLALVGGATGLVGDPSGKTEARRMLTREQIDANAAAIAKQIASIVRFADDASDPDHATGAELVNNADWLEDLTWIEVLRDVGSRVSVNRMVSMESVKGRLKSESGISYLEFSYMIMQAYDFVHLHRERGCTLQLGGQDQWGNIVMGIELGRKLDDADLAGLTLPLVTRSDGAKFGKSEAGNIWLDPKRTSPYDFYQFWRNTADADVRR
ncbi:MAG: tyrosine--tRNA ligase, partial [Phycisphaeraceae bacterium]